MSYTVLMHVATGDVATAALQNTFIDNGTEIRGGGLALASQAALDFVFASTATQLARLAKGTGLQYLRMNSGATAYEFASLPPAPALSTATGVISITIAGLDLPTDLGYDFDIETTDAAGATTNSLTAQVNGSAGSADGWEGTYNRALTPSPTGGGGTGANLWEISAAQVSAKWSGRLSLRLVGAGPHPYATWHVTGLDSTGGAQNVFGVHGSGMRQATTNVTSIKFALSGSTCDWRVIVRKIQAT